MSIISISGKKGSGKDTVGRMIQVMLEMTHFTDQAVLNFTKRDFPDPKHKIKKFASKLKIVGAILLNCKPEQFEDEEFKNTPLGEEWWYYHFDGGIMIPYTKNGYREGEEPLQYLVKTTPRLFLQLLGTECGRQILHPNIWINSLMNEYKETQDWIITDLRFKDELQAVVDRDSLTVRVNRNSIVRPTTEHASETDLDDYREWDWIINNDGTELELVAEVRKMLHFFNQFTE